jgi:L-amino acid N-acyltransferase YncA
MINYPIARFSNLTNQENNLSDINFQRVGQSHYEEITDLFNYFILNSTAIAFNEVLKTEEVVSYFELNRFTTFAYCIYYDSDFCGFCILRQYSNKPGYLYTHEITIYLKDEYTGKGIGSIAIKFLENLAKEKGIRTIVAGISSENEASIKLFERNHYIKCGHFKNMVIKFNRVLDNIYYQKLL